jgi:methionyl-tRNA formyltransferase
MKKRIIFFTSDNISIPMLNWIINDSKKVKIVGIVTVVSNQKNKIKLKNYNSNKILSWAKKYNIPVFKIFPNEKKFLKKMILWIKEKKPELNIVFSFGKILNKRLINFIESFNFHPSILPEYKGPSPIISAIIENKRSIGISLMKMNSNIDGGPIIDVEKTKINKFDFIEKIKKLVSHSSINLLKRNFKNMLNGKLIYKDQNLKFETQTRKIKKIDGMVDFSKSPTEIFNRFRAFHSWPGCYFFYKKNFIKIGEMIIPKNTIELKNKKMEFKNCGRVLKFDEKIGLIICVSNGFISFKKLQRSGRRMLDINVFLRGFKITLGTKLVGIKNQRPIVYKKFS